MSRTLQQIDADLRTCAIGRQAAIDALAQRGHLNEVDLNNMKARVDVMNTRIDRLLDERFLAFLEGLVTS